MTTRPSGYARRENDLYETPAWATEALLRRFPLNDKLVWDPCAGNHAIADAIECARLTRAGIITSDIKVYDREHDIVADFLTDEALPHIDHDAIVMNPPYGWHNQMAEKFIRRALSFSTRTLVAALLPVKFDSGKTRLDLTEDHERFCAKIVLVDRLQLIPGTTVQGTEDHAWFVWDIARFDSGLPSLMYEGRDAR
jgi:hypothetical protein